MATVDPLTQLKAYALGGPSAAQDYVNQQKGAGDLKQQALSALSSGAQSAGAPANFLKSQEAITSVPLDALSQAGAVRSSANSQLISNLPAAANLYKGAVQQEMNSPEMTAQLHSDQAKAYSDALTQAKQLLDMQNSVQTAATKQQKTNTLSEIAGRQDVSQDTYDTVADVVGKADTYDQALRNLQADENNTLQDDGTYMGSDGKILKYDPSAARAWLMQAYLTPQQIQAVGKYGNADSAAAAGSNVTLGSLINPQGAQ